MNRFGVVMSAALAAGCGRYGFVDSDGSINGYKAIILADHPLAYWRLGEASGTIAADATGNGNTGVYGGGVAMGSPGAIPNDSDTAVTFNGSNSLVSVGAGFDFTGSR